MAASLVALWELLEAVEMVDNLVKSTAVWTVDWWDFLWAELWVGFSVDS